MLDSLGSTSVKEVKVNGGGLELLNPAPEIVRHPVKQLITSQKPAIATSPELAEAHK